MAADPVSAAERSVPGEKAAADKASPVEEVVLLPVQGIPLPRDLGLVELNPGFMFDTTLAVIQRREVGALPSVYEVTYGEDYLTMTFRFFATPEEAKKEVAAAHKRAMDSNMIVASELGKDEPGVERFACGILSKRMVFVRRHNVEVVLDADKRLMAMEDLGKVLEKLMVFLKAQGIQVANAGEMREWQNQEGKKIRAKLLKYDRERKTADLQLENGQFSRGVSVDKFSEADQEFLSVFGVRAPVPAEAAGVTPAGKK